MLEILEIYQLRAKLHRQLYQHRIANVAEAMITDIFVAANEHFRVKGGDGVPMKISEAAHDPTSFVLLTDSILDALDLSPAEGLEKAAKLLARLKKRDFYQAVGDTPVNIETLPLCTNPKCMKGTPLDAKFCPHCGCATASRTGKCKRDIWRSEGVALTATEALNQILAKIEPQAVREEMQDGDALFVKIVDIQVGKKTTWRDPNNILWEVFDPLSNVGFHNPKYEGHEEEGKLKHVRQDMMPQMYLPKATHTRTLWCYLREENPRACRGDKGAGHMEGDDEPAMPGGHIECGEPRKAAVHVGDAARARLAELAVLAVAVWAGRLVSPRQGAQQLARVVPGPRRRRGRE